MKTQMMNRIKLTTGAVLLALLAGPMSFAKGDSGGVGNGGENARQAYVQKLKQQLGKKSIKKGASLDDLTGWCSDATGMIKRELLRAQNLINRGDFENAILIMRDALEVAGASIELDPDLAAPLTKSLIDRGIMLAIALDDTLTDNTRFQLTTKVNFLVEYTQFIIRTERELDRDWYIPYRYKYYDGCRRKCDTEFNYSEFERKFISYAQDQLEFVLNYLAEVKFVRGNAVAVPLGDAKAFLKASELETAFVAEDISGNLHANEYACVIEDLENLSSILTDFNLFGDRTIFRTEKIAVQGSYDEMSSISREISNLNNRCRR